MNTICEVKLDSCGSVSLAHPKFLSSIKECKQYGIPIVTLNGIGGKTLPITRAGILSHVKPHGKIVKFLCYVFDTPVGNTNEILLLGLKTIVEADIDIRYHMKLSVQGVSKMVRFVEDVKDTPLSSSPKKSSIKHGRVEVLHYKIEVVPEPGRSSAVERYRRTTYFDECENTILMTEIQLKNIVERLQMEEKDTKTDGDETMVKDGVVISKFSREALGLGDDVDPQLRQRIYDYVSKWIGDDSVFPTKNGSPKILTKFVEHPYSYELLPEYERGEKKLPCVKAMNWEGKTNTASVIRGFIKGTPVVEPCSNPRCISRLVIVPKLAPGQAKDDPNHGFRVCVNALINKCLKPCASTIPLATDEIRKLFNCKYFLQLDGMNAYWSIPVCEESKRLTAFHTPDGIYCWNRLLMGAKPSSAVQQSAYLEALDKYIDYDENGNLRKCLLDQHGNRLKDKDGNEKTLRHKFAVYCDDIAAGADTLEELYELFEALLCCCAKAGIQVKASKVKFGVKELTFHNYTISKDGMKPKEANLCPIRNMSIPRDVHQVKAFLGCCQQMATYVKEYAIIASPLHNLTKKATIFPKPWLEGSDYDTSFHRLKAILLDTNLYLHHKNPDEMLFIEVDASDVGWGACAYQMYKRWEGDPNDEARGRINDMGQRKIIEWISKSWNEHELKLPVFYRESLGRLLCLERFRNLIETNIQAGVALYTDHKPGLFENSLSNKGQLSAWRIAETADLQSLVQTHYRQGSKMLLADPLSRLCSPSSGFFDPTLPSKLQALLKYLPENLKKHENFRVYAYKDTAALSRHVQLWRELKNPISQGRLSSSVAKNSFHLGIMHSDGSLKELQNLLLQNKQFAVLCPIGIISEISRKENGPDNSWECDKEIDNLVHKLSKLVLTQDNQVWLINLHDQERFVDVLSAEAAGCTVDDARNIMHQSLDSLMKEITNLPDWDFHNHSVGIMPSQKEQGACDQFVQTRTSQDSRNNSDRSKRRKIHNVTVEPIQNWIGSQLEEQNVPKTIMDQLVADHPDYPNGLLVLPTSEKGIPRVLVPRRVQYDLVLQAHLDIHHQHYRKVHKLLRPLYYWPNMDSDIESICKSCSICHAAKVRRQKLQADFDAQAPQAYARPRQHYGIDFYGVQGGEILVIVDLFTRETILEWLPSRKQGIVVDMIMRRIIFERGVPFSIRSDNAPELMRGIVKKLCEYLNITQILTGGHNPRGNAICERANQTLGAILRKLNDHEYKNIKTYIPAFQFAMNITPHSAIGCSPFEAGHGVPANTLSSARLLANRYQHNHLEGQDGDVIEDSNSTELQGQVKNLIELAMRMTEVVKSTSEWHRRMTSQKLAQNGRKINYEDYKIGSKVYFYKPPSAAEAEKRGRKAKHMDHYSGPATITQRIGIRSYLIEYKDAEGKTRLFQRDAGMLSLVPPHLVQFEPEEQEIPIRPPHRHRSLTASPVWEGEVVILKDGLEAEDWYCAEIFKVLPTHVVVHYYTTITPSLVNYSTVQEKEREIRISQATFLKTWCLNKGKGPTTTIPPEGIKATRDVWSGKIKIHDLQSQLLIRNVILNAMGKLSKATAALAASLKYPHHQGA